MKKIFTLCLTVISAGLSFAQDSLTAKEMDAVVITGQYKPQSVKNSVYQVRVINQERIRQSGAANIQQVLNTQLGFRFSNDNTLGTSDVQLMGMSGRNVKILLDGVPMIDRGDTRESLNQVDINNIERIEIVEGPMSVSYGSDALAGVINIITKKNSKNSFSVIAKVQEETAGNEFYPFSYKGQHNQHIGFLGNRKGWQWSISGTHNEFDGVGGDNYGRAKTWKPKEQWLGNFKIGYATHDFNIYYRMDGLDEMIKDRGAININTYKAIDKRYSSHRFMHQLQSSWNINEKWQWNTAIAYTDYNRKTTTTRHDFEKNTDELTTGAGEQDRSAFNSFLFRNTIFYKLNSRFSLQPGMEINREAASGARISGSPVITDYALFISTEWKPTDKINIRPGLRFLKNSVYDAPPVIPSINAKLVLSNKTDLRLAYAYGFRSPALRELYFDFHDANHQIVGNTELKAEHSNSFTASVQQLILQKEKTRVSSTLSGFYNEFRNLINYAQSATDPNLFVTVNLDRFKTTGISLENKLDWKNLNAGLGVSYIGRYNSFSDDPVFKEETTPAFTWSPEVAGNFIYALRKISASIGFFYKFTGTRPGYQVFFNNTTGKDELQLTKVSSFHWADLSLSKSLFKYFTVTAGVKNIFDVTNLNSTAGGSVHTGSGPVPMGYGRSYFLGLNFQWNKK